MMNSKSTRVCLFGLMMWVSAGCGFGLPRSTERQNMVIGEVSFGDKKIPAEFVDGTIVQLHPADGESSGPKFTGPVIDGKYVICTEEGDESFPGGVPEGDYVVTVTPIPKLPRPIPKKYTDPKTSDIKVTVEQGANEFELVLHP